jgi:hypothetical protein
MKFIISSGELQKALQTVSGVISSSQSRPILENYLFELDGNNVTITASDGETTLVTSLEVKSDDTGKFAVPAKIFQDFIKTYGEQPLTFVVKDNAEGTGSQLEILDDELGHLKKYPSYLGFLSRALSVWDYSPKNISFLKAKGFNNLAYIPPGYHPICEKVSRQNSRHDFDFLFIGALSKRRANLLEALMKRGHKVGAITDSKPAFGETRDQVMANSKIILNIHCFDNLNNLETVRLSYLLTNRAVVISEESDHDPYQGAIGYAKYEDLVDYCDSILFEDKLEMRSKSGYAAIKSIDMLDLLGQALLKIDIHSAR